MKRSHLGALLAIVLTASVVLGQARLLPPSITESDNVKKAEPVPSVPAKSRAAVLQPPTSLPTEDEAPDVPANAPPHQMYGRTPAHGTMALTAGVPQAPFVKTMPVEQYLILPAPDVRGPAGRFWAEVDYLLWLPDGDSPPALVTSSPAGTPLSTAGVLNNAGTAILAGGRQINDDPRSGARVNVGFWFDALQTFGIQAGGFWLADNNSSTAFTSNGNLILARPFVDAATGLQSAELIAYPSVSAGSVVVNAHSSLYGGDVALRQNAACSKTGRIDWLLGYRQLRLADQLEIIEDVTATAGGYPRGLPPGSLLHSIDRFNTANNFYGAEFGLVGEYRSHGWVAEGLVKMATGWNVSRVNINGTTVLVPGGAANGGLLALPTNIGVYRQTEWALIPEVGVNLAYDFNCHLRMRGGYSFIYWDQVFRPGQQIDTGVNPGLVPPVVGGGPARPLPVREETDIYIHGLNVGVEVRY